MAKVAVRYADYFAQTIQRMREDGLLLVTLGADGKPNVMTIGWGTIGSIWARPVFIVMGICVVGAGLLRGELALPALLVSLKP